ncbi:MAG TPA: POTRA domain-containing protein [Candidatus Angelobacter sp.]|nr:POTRA domain-containing protein [Candidatus Angelobacter sp.]
MNAPQYVRYLCVFILALQILTAQQITPPTISYEGQNVSAVDIAGRPDLNVRQLRSLIAQPTEAPYSKTKIDETMAALKNATNSKDVQLEVRPQPNGLQILFVLQPAYYFGIFDFGTATKVFTYTRLLQVSNYPNQEPYSSSRVEEAESGLIDFFHRVGYFEATVEPELQSDSAHGVVNVLFHVNLKRKAKFGNIILTGASDQETKRLEKSLRSWGARLRGAYLKSGKPYSFKSLDTATNYLQAQLGKQQYLAGHVEMISANYNPATNRADVTFKVTQGEKVAINVQGAHVWGRTQKKLIPIYQENSVDADLVQEGANNLVSYFQSKGFFDAKVTSRMDQNSAGTTVVYVIEKGKKGKVNSIFVRGNHNFPEDDLLSHITVAKGHFLSHGKYSQQVLRKSVKNLEAIYKNAGYSQATVTPNVVNDDRGNLKITFQVNEGTQDVVQNLRIEGNNTIPEAELAPKGLNLVAGKPYSAQLLDKDRDQIIATYLDRGYLTATFKAVSRPLKNDPHHVDVVYTIEEGPQVRTVTVETLGSHHTRPEIIARNAKIPPGQPLSESYLLKSESQLYTLGVFDWASVDPQRPITKDSDVEVLIKLHEAKRNSLTYGFGFEAFNRGGAVPGGTIALPNLPPVGLPATFKTSQKTFYGPRGSIEYSRFDFRGRAETLTLGMFGSRLDQRISGNWSNPSFWNSIWSSSLTLSGERTSENAIFTAQIGQAGLQFQRFVDAKKTETLFLRYTFRRTNLSHLLVPDLVTPEDRNERLSTLSASFIRDTRDNALDAHKGIYQSLEAAINPSALGSNTNFYRFLGQTAYYHHVGGGDHLIWANSLRLGFEQAYAGDHVPLSERFFSGGGSTLRGFPLNGAGPQRNVAVCSNPADTSSCSQIRVPVGGSQLVILNSELRFPIPLELPLIGAGLGGVFFYDGGNVYNSVGLSNIFSSYTNTLGFGFRYKTPVGPVRFDIGHNLNPVTGIRATQFFITLGQAF